MIHDIGFMIAAYIFTRMIGLLQDDGVKTTTKVFAFLTIVVVLVAGFDLILNAGRMAGISG